MGTTLVGEAVGTEVGLGVAVGLEVVVGDRVDSTDGFLGVANEARNEGMREDDGAMVGMGEGGLPASEVSSLLLSASVLCSSFSICSCVICRCCWFVSFFPPTASAANEAETAVAI